MDQTEQPESARRAVLTLVIVDRDQSQPAEVMCGRILLPCAVSRRALLRGTEYVAKSSSAVVEQRRVERGR